MRKFLRIGSDYYNLDRIDKIRFEESLAIIRIGGQNLIHDDKEARALRIYLDSACVTTDLSPLLRAKGNA